MVYNNNHCYKNTKYRGKYSKCTRQEQDVGSKSLKAIAKQKGISWCENINSKIAKSATRFVIPCRCLPCG